MTIVLAGIVLGFSLIVAVGPQNVYIIKQGIRREGITAVLLACTISDIFLITAGTPTSRTGSSRCSSPWR